MLSLVVALALLLTVASARDIYITVDGNQTDASKVFSPQSVTAELGDTVFFNFTNGNVSAIEALFYAPCLPAHDADPTQNGFYSGFRDTANGTVITDLPVPITPEIENKTLWFFDWNTCAKGGVGVINVNETTLETLDGFTRNAIRLNGTGRTSSSSSQSQTATSTGSSPFESGSDSGDDNAASMLVVGTAGVVLGGLGVILSLF